MILIASDFGLPYTTQMLAAIHAIAPDEKALILFDNLPSFHPKAAAHMIAAYAGDFPEGSVFCCVVDPGVGSSRKALALQVAGRWFTAPDNGLLSIVARRNISSKIWKVTWQPERLSASFHGRDLFAPLAALLATKGEDALKGRADPIALEALVGGEWPDEEAAIIYIDGFGNAMTGLRAKNIGAAKVVEVAGHKLSCSKTFSDLPPGEIFWYENANGLIEIACNQGDAARRLGLEIGDPIAWR